MSSSVIPQAISEEAPQQRMVASGGASSSFNPSASSWKPNRAPADDKKGPDADNWRSHGNRPAPQFKGNSWSSNANRGNSDSRAPARTYNNNQQKQQRGGSGRFESFNNNNRNAPQQSRGGAPSNNKGPKPSAKTVVEPIALPTEGPLFEFLQGSEAACHEPAFTDTLQKFDCNIQLPSKWIFWSEPAVGQGVPEPAPTREDYLKTLIQSRVFTSLAGVRDYAFEACDVPENAKILLFKQGIKPVWEDRGNYNGGRFFVACSSKLVAVNTFVTLIIKLLTGNLLPDEELNGIAVSLQGSNKFAVQVWNRNSSEKDKIKTARKAMKKLFKKNVNYHVHRTSLKINKYGLEAVLPEIEKAEAEKAAARQKEMEKEKHQKVEIVVVPDAEVSKESVTEESIVDTMAKAAVAVALASAWESRTQEATETD